MMHSVNVSKIFPVAFFIILTTKRFYT